MNRHNDIQMLNCNLNDKKNKSKKRHYKELINDKVSDNINEYFDEQFFFKQKKIKNAFSDDEKSKTSETSNNTQIDNNIIDKNKKINTINMKLEQELVKRFYEKHNKELNKAMFG